VIAKLLVVLVLLVYRGTYLLEQSRSRQVPQKSPKGNLWLLLWENFWTDSCLLGARVNSNAPNNYYLIIHLWLVGFSRVRVVIR